MSKTITEKQNRQIQQVVDDAAKMWKTDLQSAIQRLEAANAKFPGSAELLQPLAFCYESANRTIDALITLDQIIQLNLANEVVWTATGRLLTRHKEYAQAATAFEHALQLNPDSAASRHDYGKALYQLGEVAAAAREIERACQLTDELLPWMSLATMAPGNPDYSHADVLRIRQTFAQKVSATESVRADAPSVTRSEKLRVGYFSSWFDRENYMKPVWGLINQHHRDRIQLHLFTDTPASHLPGYLSDARDVIHETGSLSNGQLAVLIQSAGIDLLIDLNAYSTTERLGLFVSRPAAVTAAWFNMYATSGFSGFDYIIGDQTTVRESEEPFFCEQVVRLPQSYLTFVVTHNAPAVVEPPCLQNSFVTFGSLISQYKLTNPVLDAWADILNAVPESRLLLGNVALDSECNREHLQKRLADRGVEPDRIEFRGRATHREFLEYYNSMDIALDAFPYNGGTTTMEAVWQGVPVVTFSGDRWASRTSASILADTHLSDFVAADYDGYISTAVHLASAPDLQSRLTQLRCSMREKLLQSSVCDTPSLATAMETLFQQLAATPRPRHA